MYCYGGFYSKKLTYLKERKVLPRRFSICIEVSNDQKIGLFTQDHEALKFTVVEANTLKLQRLCFAALNKDLNSFFFFFFF